MVKVNVKRARLLDVSRSKAKKIAAAQSTTTEALSRPLLSPEETAGILGVSVQTLAVWRCKKRYDLRYVRIGSRIRYHSESVQAAIQRGVGAVDG